MAKRKSRRGKRTNKYIEPAMAMASGMLAEPVSGWAGLLAMAAGPEAAAEAINKTREAMTYAPRSQEGRDTMQNIGYAMEPVGNAFENLNRKFGDTAYDVTGSPVAASMATAIPTAIMSLPAFRATKMIDSPGVPGRFQQSGQIGTKRALQRRAIGRKANARPATIAKRTEEYGGYTVDPRTGEIPDDGIMVGRFKNGSPNTMVLDNPPTAADIKKFYDTNAQALNQQDMYVGTWGDIPQPPKTYVNPAEGKPSIAGGWPGYKPPTAPTNKWYVDVSKRFPDDKWRNSVKYGEKSDQLAGIHLTDFGHNFGGSGFGVGKYKEFPIRHWEDYLKTDEFVNNMRKAGKEGNNYLKQHGLGGGKEWWDIKGTEVEKAFGPDTMKQAAGFIAATAPNTNPIDNMQRAMEYMRRYIKGEPVIQPDYKIPGDAAFRKPGGMVGLEAGRVKDLLHAEKGDIGGIPGDKVRNEALALDGDPNAVVLDRHWTRIAEKPSEGYVMGSNEGVLPKRTKDLYPYEELANAVREEARRQGRSPRDFSADVWTGMRERAKQGDIFGSPTDPKSIVGDSKGYADIFVDLVKMKAKHLGLTPDELYIKLRNGEADLF